MSKGIGLVANFTPDLLTPPREEEEFNPYRNAWRSIYFEMGLLIGFSIIAYIIFIFLGISFPPTITLYINILIAILPALLWLYFSAWKERSVPEPRQKLILVFIISGLIANAISIPFLNEYLNVSSWLSQENAFNRIIGYAFTVGIVQEVSKYLVIRHVTWFNYRNREDSIAYNASAAIGYGTVVCLQFSITSDISSGAVALQVLHIIVVHMVASLIMSYGIAELKFNPSSLILLPLLLIIAAFTTGIAIPIRTGLINAGFALGISYQNLLFDLIFSIIFLIMPIVAIVFLYNTSERRERESIGGTK